MQLSCTPLSSHLHCTAPSRPSCVYAEVSNTKSIRLNIPWCEGCCCSGSGSGSNVTTTTQHNGTSAPNLATSTKTKNPAPAAAIQTLKTWLDRRCRWQQTPIHPHATRHAQPQRPPVATRCHHPLPLPLPPRQHLPPRRPRFPPRLHPTTPVDAEPPPSHAASLLAPGTAAARPTPCRSRVP